MPSASAARDALAGGGEVEGELPGAVEDGGAEERAAEPEELVGLAAAREERREVDPALGTQARVHERVGAAEDGRAGGGVAGAQQRARSLEGLAGELDAQVEAARRREVRASGRAPLAGRPGDGECARAAVAVHGRERAGRVGAAHRQAEIVEARARGVRLEGLAVGEGGGQGAGLACQGRPLEPGELRGESAERRGAAYEDRPGRPGVRGLPGAAQGPERQRQERAPPRRARRRRLADRAHRRSRYRCDGSGPLPEGSVTPIPQPRAPTRRYALGWPARSSGPRRAESLPNPGSLPRSPQPAPRLAGAARRRRVACPACASTRRATRILRTP